LHASAIVIGVLPLPPTSRFPILTIGMSKDFGLTIRLRIHMMQAYSREKGNRRNPIDQ